MKLTSGVAAAFIGLAAVPASAVTLDFGTQADGNATNYVEDGFIIDVARIVNGNCDSDTFGGSGPSCGALNPNEDSTIRVNDGGAGGLFTLESFWFELFGGGSNNLLRVTSSAGGLLEFRSGDWPSHDGYFYTVTDVLFQNVEWVMFSGSDDRGNRRIDDLSLQMAAVPVPAAGFMLLGGLAGLGLFGRRKRSA